MALLVFVRSVCCSASVDTSQKERHSLWAAGLTLAHRVGSSSPLSSWGRALGDLKSDSVEGHKLTGRKVLRSGGDLCSWEYPRHWLFGWCPWPQTLQLKRNDTELLSYVCYLLEIQPRPHFALPSYKILYNFGVILWGLSSVLVLVAEFASLVGLFLPGVQKCMSGKEKCLFCLFVLIDPIF